MRMRKRKEKDKDQEKMVRSRRHEHDSSGAAKIFPRGLALLWGHKFSFVHLVYIAWFFLLLGAPGRHQDFASPPPPLPAAMPLHDRWEFKWCNGQENHISRTKLGGRISCATPWEHEEHAVKKIEALTFLGWKSYLMQCWNPFPLTFTEVTTRHDPMKWPE